MSKKAKNRTYVTAVVLTFGLFVFCMVFVIASLLRLSTFDMPEDILSYLTTESSPEKVTVTQPVVTTTPTPSLVHTAAANETSPLILQVSTTTESSSGTKKTHEQYIEVIESCDQHYGGECLNVRSGPGTEYPAIAHVRRGVVLRVAEAITSEDHTWYQVVFNEWLRYPDRVVTKWYIASDFVRLIDDVETASLEDTPLTATSTKHIIVNRSEQTLYAYDGDTLFISLPISTGLEMTPTPRGTFTIYYKTPSRYMQGPIPGISNDYYDLPGVPWNLYFTEQGAVIHGAYWHDSFGSQYSHGCVNLDPKAAEKLYRWADVGTAVTVRD